MITSPKNSNDQIILALEQAHGRGYEAGKLAERKLNKITPTLRRLEKAALAWGKHQKDADNCPAQIHRDLFQAIDAHTRFLSRK